MCIIVDTNMAADVFSRKVSADLRPVINWLVGSGGKLVVGGKLTVELNRNTEVGKQLVELKRSGKLRTVVPAPVDAIRARVGFKSNDDHIIALALASNARVLVSRDRLLHADFTNPSILSPKGKVYQTARHAKLLRQDTCP